MCSRTHRWLEISVLAAQCCAKNAGILAQSAAVLNASFAADCVKEEDVLRFRATNRRGKGLLMVALPQKYRKLRGMW